MSSNSKNIIFISSLAICIFILSTCLALSASAATYYIDAAHGDDSNPGSQKAPFKTVMQASKVLKAGDVAMINEGIYHEQIGGGDSGGPASPVTYQGVDRDKVRLTGAVHVRDWVRHGPYWIKKGLEPITHINAFVMVDEKRMLARAPSLKEIKPGSFFLTPNGDYYIMLSKGKNPNTDHRVDVYEYDFAFNSGDRWGGTAKKHIRIANLTMEKYGVYAISTDADHPADNSHWELDNIRVRLNREEGIFYCLDDWRVHDSLFINNGSHGCQINGARVVFENNISRDNEFFGRHPDGGCGLLIGPDETARDNIIRNNIFKNNGDKDGYGCGVYLEGRSSFNRIENNTIIGGTHSGIGFYGSSDNFAFNNLLIDPAASSEDRSLAAAFAFGPSFEGDESVAKRNLVAHNTVWGCPTPVAAVEMTVSLTPAELNRLVNNLFAGCRFQSDSTITEAADFLNNGFFTLPGAFQWDEARLEQAGLESLNLSGPDPMLTAPDQGDFTPAPGSPLVDAGAPVEGAELDGKGFSRTSDKGPDIGAYESTITH